MGHSLILVARLCYNFFSDSLSSRVSMFYSIVSTFDLEKLSEETKGLPDQGALLYDYAWTHSLYQMVTKTTAGLTIGAASSLFLFKSNYTILAFICDLKI